MSVYRYINNSATDVVAGEHTVKAWDQLILNEPTDALDFKVGTFLQCLKDGVNIETVHVEGLEPEEVEIPEKITPTGSHVPEVFKMQDT